MRIGSPAPDDRQHRNGHQRVCAAIERAAGPLDARRARMAAFWALVLCRFRDYANQGAGQERPGEEDP